MNIGEKLQARRKELNLTQETAAIKLHVSRQAISNWETGKNYPDLDTIIAISNLYEISLDTLLKGDKLIVKKIKKNMYTSIIKRGVAFLGLLSIIISLIINFAITRSLTWSLIPAISIVGLGIVWLIFEKTKNHKLIKSAICFSMLVPLYFWLLEKILISNNYIQEKEFFKHALSISLLWLGIIWIVAIVHMKIKWHWCYSIALLCLMSIGGNLLTNMLVGNANNGLSMIVTTISNGVVGTIAFFLGNSLSRNKRIK